MAIFHHRIKSGKKGRARDHAAYIERQGRFGVREDLIHTGFGNMPSWAEGNPALFWAMADRHERSNGAAYREHEIALPNELTRDQLIALAERLVRELVGNKPYQYAIHAPEGALGGVLNPHMHLMFSDRVPDGVSRSAPQTFLRFNAKRPEIGGCRKDSGGKTPLELRDALIATRRLIAGVENDALAEHGHEARVDHRKLRDQGHERLPERHLGPARIRHMASEEKALYALARADNAQGA